MPDTLDIPGDFDQIPVRVSEIHGTDLSRRPCARHRTFLNGDADADQMIQNLRDRRRCNETQISGPGNRISGMRFNRGIGRVKVEFLLTKHQGATAPAKRGRLHSQDVCIECRASLNVPNRQHEVVDSIDLHPGCLRRPTRILNRPDLLTTIRKLFFSHVTNSRPMNRQGSRPGRQRANPRWIPRGSSFRRASSLGDHGKMKWRSTAPWPLPQRHAKG